MAVILVVEDEVFTREIAEMTIQDWGHQALSAGDIDEAVPSALLVLDRKLNITSINRASAGGFEIEDDFPGLGRRDFGMNARKISQPGSHAHRIRSNLQIMVAAAAPIGEIA